MEDNFTVMSHSRLATWRRCRYKFDLTYRRKYKPKNKSQGLLRGSVGHFVLEQYYKPESKWTFPQDTEEVMELWEDKEGVELEDKTWDEAYDALMRYFTFAEENDNWEHLETELKFKIPIATDSPLQLMGYIDGIVKEKGSGRVWLLEHKFQKMVSTKHLQMDQQVSIYMMVAKILGYDPAGVIYNMIRIGSGPTALREPVVREHVYRNPEGLVAIFRDLKLQAEEAYEFLTKGGRIYRNSTSNCHWDCQFYRVCLSINDTGDAQSVLDTMEQGG